MVRVNLLVKRIRNAINKKRLNNMDFSIISSNCNGAVIVHDLGLRFNSPFVNLFILPQDYLKLLVDLRGYMSEPLTFVLEDNISFPVGVLRDIRIYFQHYESEEEALLKWNERKKRIHYDNLFILFSDRDGCTYDDLKRFDKLPYKNKAVFTHIEYPEIESAVYIKGFESEESIGICSEFMPNSLGKYYLDQFDYVKWFNGGSNC